MANVSDEVQVTEGVKKSNLSRVARGINGSGASLSSGEDHLVGQTSSSVSLKGDISSRGNSAVKDGLTIGFDRQSSGLGSSVAEHKLVGTRVAVTLGHLLTNQSITLLATVVDGTVHEEINGTSDIDFEGVHFLSNADLVGFVTRGSIDSSFSNV